MQRWARPGRRLGARRARSWWARPGRLQRTTRVGGLVPGCPGWLAAGCYRGRGRACWRQHCGMSWGRHAGSPGQHPAAAPALPCCPGPAAYQAAPAPTHPPPPAPLPCPAPDDSGGEGPGEAEEEGDEYQLPTSHEVVMGGHTKAVTCMDIDHSGSRIVGGAAAGRWPLAGSVPCLQAARRMSAAVPCCTCRAGPATCLRRVGRLARSVPCAAPCLPGPAHLTPCCRCALPRSPALWTSACGCTTSTA